MSRRTDGKEVSPFQNLLWTLLPLAPDAQALPRARHPRVAGLPALSRTRWWKVLGAFLEKTAFFSFGYIIPEKGVRLKCLVFKKKQPALCFFSLEAEMLSWKDLLREECGG